jgi:aspartokinase
LETTASYCEPRIKTYGFQRMTDLVLLEMTAADARIDSLGLAFCRMGEEDIGFHLVFSRASSEGIEICLIVPAHRAGAVKHHIDQLVPGGAEKIIRRTNAADLVFFQGPHFGDRYGILEVAVQALDAKGIRRIAVACSGACIYIVVPEGRSEETVAALAESFEIPRVSSRRAPATV